MLQNDTNDEHNKSGLRSRLRTATLALRADNAANRFMLAARRLHEALLELRYSPDQPRAPAGTPEGGQWIDAGGSSGGNSRILLSAGKPDIKFIEYLLGTYGIVDRKTRRRIHDDITRQDLSTNELELYISGFAK